MNFAVGTYSQSTIRGGAGVTRFTNSGIVTLAEGTSILGGDGSDTVSFGSALIVTSDEGVVAMGAELTPLPSAITGGSVFGGASFGDTAAGNDTSSSPEPRQQPKLTWVLARTSSTVRAR